MTNILNNNVKKYIFYICLFFAVLGISSCDKTRHWLDERAIPKYHHIKHRLKEKIAPPLEKTKHWFEIKLGLKNKEALNNLSRLETTQAIKTYEDYQGQSRVLSQTGFDGIPTDAQADPQYVFKDPPLNFDVAKIARPSPAKIASFTAKYPLIRPVPFPYYSVFSIPSDACGSLMSDIYYSEALFQRKYGLDLTSSFFPVSDYPISDPTSPVAPSFISSTAVKPLSHPVQSGNDTIDNLPAFLTYYYRGWIDHIHGWTTEGTFFSLVEPAMVSGSEGGNKKNLNLIDVAVRFDGIYCNFQTQGQVQSFVLRLLDSEGIEHFIAVGSKLAKNQQGWEFALPKNATKIDLYASMLTEKNRHPLNLMGRLPSVSGAHFQNADLTVYGSPTSQVELKMIQQVPFERLTVAKQIDLLRQYNIFPVVSSYHGGNSSWYQEIEIPNSNLTVDFAGKKYEVLRPSLGSQLGTPTYISDLFNQFGIFFRSNNENKIEIATSEVVPIRKFVSGVQYYFVPRALFVPNSQSLLSTHHEHAENLGPVIVDFVQRQNDFGLDRILYTHFNYYNKEAFATLPKDFSSQLMHIRKLPPSTEKALSALADLKYNRSGTLEPYQRVWVPSISVNARYSAILQQLLGHTTLVGNTVKIQDWLDPVSARKTPDINNPTLDLHGQTFYVPDSASASVWLNGKSLPALKRNSKDLTGRESVTVVDLTHPKLFFDQLDPIENHYARIDHGGASLFYQAHYSLPGKYTLQAVSEKPGVVFVAIKPFLFDNYETDFFRFIVKKSRPDLQFYIGWKGIAEHVFVASSHTVAGQNSSWKIPFYQDTAYHDYVVDFSDLNYVKGAPLARGPVNEIQIGMLNAQPGDAVTIDRIEFLAAPGVKAEEGGFVLGGRILPGLDNVPVKIAYGNQEFTTRTERGGWYFFKKIPKNAIAEITAEYKGVTFTPARGRLIQVHRNDVEYHINVADARSNSVPRPNLTGMKTLSSMQSGVSSEEALNKFDAYRSPHTKWAYAGAPGNRLSYVGEDFANNFGYMDKDRREENVDHALRILILGFCLEEGNQTPHFQHMNLMLESMLRQKLGRNVEVIVAATSSSSISSRWDSLEKYGQRFKPDLVLLMNNAGNLLHMEPTLQERYIGFKREHPPYVLFDFDSAGKLQKINRDPLYGTHVLKPTMAPLNANVPLAQSFMTPEVTLPLVERSYQLLEAVILQQYIPLVKSWGGRVALGFGYYPVDYPSVDGKNANNYLRKAEFFDRMQQTCLKTGIPCLDLSNELFRPDYKEIATWEADSHLTPTGHYLLAKAVMNAVLPLIEKKPPTRSQYVAN